MTWELGVTRFGFSRLSEFPTPSYRASPGGRCMARRLMSSCKAAWLIRLIDLEDQPVFRARRGAKPNRIQTLLQGSFKMSACRRYATAVIDSRGIVSCLQGSLRNNITQQRTSSLRATATIAFFRRVFWFPQMRWYTARAQGL